MAGSKAPVPSLAHERHAWRDGKQRVAGVDEVGRGAWAGPLVAAAVALPAEPASRARLTRALNNAGLTVRDSKQLRPEQRRRIVDILARLSIPTAIAEVPVSAIDSVGVGRANTLALREAVLALDPDVDLVLADAFAVPDLSCRCVPIVRGDCISMTIALASIVAKTYRDRRMAELDEQWPQYGFAAHKGYGTAAHRRALGLHGPCVHHRSSFAPIAGMNAGVVAD